VHRNLVCQSLVCRSAARRRQRQRSPGKAARGRRRASRPGRSQTPSLPCRPPMQAPRRPPVRQRLASRAACAPHLRGIPRRYRSAHQPARTRGAVDREWPARQATQARGAARRQRPASRAARAPRVGGVVVRQRPPSRAMRARGAGLQRPASRMSRAARARMAPGRRTAPRASPPWVPVRTSGPPGQTRATAPRVSRPCGRVPMKTRSACSRRCGVPTTVRTARTDQLSGLAQPPAWRAPPCAPMRTSARIPARTGRRWPSLFRR